MDRRKEKLNISEETKQELQIIRLRNSKSTELCISNFGAAVISLKFLNKGETINVVVGPEDPADYLREIYHKKGKFFGATVGRHAGRISNGGFELDGKNFHLFEGEGVHLHGGKYGFSYKFWKLEEVREGKDPFVRLRYFSKDGEEGYPGNLQVEAKYTLTEEDHVKIQYSAVSDKKTVLNLTNHTYFNLNGGGSINDHSLQVAAEKKLEVDEQTVPTGKFLELDGAEDDFSEPKLLKEIFLDTAYQLKDTAQKSCEQVCLKGGKSSIRLRVKTNQPAVVVYVPEELPMNWNYGTDIAESRAAICLETQQLPDAPHHPEFGTAFLEAGEKYVNETIWIFETEDKIFKRP